LVALWTDLNSLTKDQFLAELETILEPNAPRPTKLKRATKSKGKVPTDNRPATRIAFELQEISKVSASNAQAKIKEALLTRGYSPSDVPVIADQSLQNWLEELLKTVPSSEVMDIAKKLN